MGTAVLARKWRPKTFADLVGQEHISRTLINALNSDRLHHAYLFAGTRGVGKTTLARILAKSFSCEDRKTAEPCNKCSACEAIDLGSYPDLIEVDAASRTGVEDTRDLLSDTQFAPSKGKYKIYLIDEVHMLSNHSFNALLKTLEEPPPHILFLFATTDPQKLPGTVLSRCLKFNLKPLQREDIVAHLKKVLQEEKVEYDEESLKHLAHQADGSMRDALSLTDQAISYCRNKLNGKEVGEMLGIAGIPPAETLLFHLAKDEPKALLETTERIENSGGNFADLADRLLETIQSIAVLQTGSIKPTEDEKELAELANLLSPEELQIYYQTIILTKKELPWVPSARRAFEMGLLRMLSLQPMLSEKSKIVPKAEKEDAGGNASGEASGGTKAEKGTNQAASEGKQDAKQDAKQDPKQDTKQDTQKADVTAKQEEAGTDTGTEDTDTGTTGTNGTEGADAETGINGTEGTDTGTGTNEESGTKNAEQLPKKKPLDPNSVPDSVPDSVAAGNSNNEIESADIFSEIKTGNDQPAKTPSNNGEQPALQGDTETEANTENNQPAKTPSNNGEQLISPADTEIEGKTESDQPAKAADTATKPSAQGEGDTEYTTPEGWAGLLQILDGDLVKGRLAASLEHTRLMNTDRGAWVIGCAANERDVIVSEKDNLEEAITQQVRQRVMLEIQVAAVEQTPFMIMQQRREQLVKDTKKDPLVKTLEKEFGGELDESSVRSAR